MNLEDITLDPRVLANGAWIRKIPNMDDLHLKVRPMNNADYRAMLSDMTASVERSQRNDDGRITQAEMDRIQAECMLATVLMDWDNLKVKGVKHPYDPSLARQLMTAPQYPDFRDAVAFAAERVKRARGEELETSEGNLSPLSTGTSTGASNNGGGLRT